MNWNLFRNTPRRKCIKGKSGYYFKYGIVIFLSKDGFWATNFSHSSGSILPSPFKSASLKAYAIYQRLLVDTKPEYIINP
jgi:hypothetical protein